MRSDNTVEIVIVGAGVNGLAAAAMLAKSGKRVLVLERESSPGGAVRTEELTLPGFKHDTFAMNLSLFAGGPVMAALGPDLQRHGFALVPSAKPFCSLFPDDTMLGVSADSARTLAAVAAVAPEDVDAWQSVNRRVDAWLPYLGDMLSKDLPSAGAARAMWKMWRNLGWTGVNDLMRLALSSTRAFTSEHFQNPRTRALMASWGMHLDFAPDIAGGALFSLLETFGGERFGMVIGRGGAAGLIHALVAVIEEHGGQVRCDTPVIEIDVRGGRARGVRTAEGSVIEASRAVVTNLNPLLLPSMLPKASLPQDSLRRVSGYRPGLATMMIHLATDAVPAWTAAEARDFNYVHVGGYLDDMAMTYTQAASGRLPDRPTLVVGQPTVTDPTRAPAGKHTVWIQVRVLPSALADGRAWDDVGDEYADHVLAMLEDRAPGLKDSILARSVLTPADLERRNVNLVGGDSLGGSHHPSQFFFLRPAPGWGRHRSPLRGLFLCGAGTWPGAGVSGTSGALVASALR